MDIGTGVFKAPKAGIYYFAFAGEKNADPSLTHIHLRLNGNNIGLADFTSNFWTLSSYHATLKLKVGDEITLVLRGGTLADDANCRNHFTGILLEEDLVIL